MRWWRGLLVALAVQAAERQLTIFGRPTSSLNLFTVTHLVLP